MIGNWSVAHGFKLNALETNLESTDNLDHHHHEEENNDMKEDNISVQNESQSALSTPNSISNVVLDEKVRTLAEGRAVAFGFKDDIDPIIVESPPPGINFTNCVVDDTNGYCCIDFVSWSFFCIFLFIQIPSRLERSGLQSPTLSWSVSLRRRKSATPAM